MNIIAIESTGGLIDAGTSYERVALEASGTHYSLCTVKVTSTDDTLHVGIVVSSEIDITIGATSRASIACHGTNAAIEAFLSERGGRSWASLNAGSIIHHDRVKKSIVCVRENSAR